MIDKTLVTSGFDIELLLGEKYLQYALLSLYETGTIPAIIPINNTNSVFIYPPPELDAQRLYEVNPNYDGDPFNLGTGQTDNAFQVTILSESEVVDIKIRGRFAVLPDLAIPLELDLFGQLFLTSDSVGRFQQNVRLNIVVNAIDLFDISDDMLEKFGTSREQILALIKEKVDRVVPLSFVGETKSIQKIGMRSYFASDNKSAAIGIYLTLKLKNGPEPDSFIESRGALTDAQNFLPAGETIAFVFNGNIFEELGRDLKFRMANLASICPEVYNFQLEIGGSNAVIKGASCGPVYVQLDPGNPGSPLIPTNQLRITIHAEIILDDMIDPDVFFHITLTPVIDDNGILTWDISFDFDSFILTLLTLGSFITAIITQNPIPALLFVGLVAGQEIIEHLATDLIENKVDDTGILDTFPNKLTIEKKRWDPLYDTNHQVHVSISQIEIINEGIFMCGNTLWLGKATKSDSSSVIRHTIKDSSNEIIGFAYSAANVTSVFEELTQEFSATDRMPFNSLTDPTENENLLVNLGIQQVLDRKAVKKIQSPVTYSPYKVDIESGKIRFLLTLSRIEFNSIKSLAKRQLKTELEASQAEAIRAEAIQRLIDQGCDSTSEIKIVQMYQSILEERIEPLTERRVQDMLNTKLRLEMAPFEIKQLQDDDFIKFVNQVDGRRYQVIRMRNGTVYIRDFPDGGARDNLLSLPTYNSSDLIF